MTWDFAPTFDAAHRAALDAGKPLVYVCPPAGWALTALAARLTPPAEAPLRLVVVPDPGTAADVAAALGTITPLTPVLAVSGLARTQRLLAERAVRTLVATPADVLALARSSALGLADVRTLLLAWPEQILALDDAQPLDTLLAETSGAQRIVATSDERHPGVADLLTRVAHRAPVLVAGRVPEAPSIPGVRWVATDEDRRAVTARAVLDVANPARAFLWEPLPERSGRWAGVAADPSVYVGPVPADERVALAIAGDLPTGELLTALGAAADAVIVLVRAAQVPYLERMAAHPRPLRVANASDVARDRAAIVRQRLRERLAGGDLSGELLTLDPLFDEYDPALVAAAALATAAAPPEPVSEEPGWKRVMVSAGRREGIRPGDLVGALLNEVGLPRAALGRIDLRDAFSLIEVRADVADRAIRGLTGVVVRGKRLTARPDRR